MFSDLATTPNEINIHQPKNFMPVRHYSEKATEIKSYFLWRKRPSRDAAVIFSVTLSEILHLLERSGK
jgi:hypothetical protein